MTFDIFFTLFEEGILSLYRPLRLKNSNELESSARYRCAVALGLDIVTNYLGRTGRKFELDERGKWLDSCPSFLDQLEWIQSDRDDFSRNESLYKVSLAFLVKLEAMLRRNEFRSDYLGRAFEKVYGNLPQVDEGGELDVLSTSNRRSSGVYFTPAEMVNFLVDHTLNSLLISSNSINDILSQSIIDPAVGPGIFLVDCVRKLSSRMCEIDPTLKEVEAKKLVVDNCVYGVDSDPLAVNVAKSVLCLECGGGKLMFRRLGRKIKVGDSLLGLTISKLNSGAYDGILNGFEGELKRTSAIKNLKKYSDVHSRYFTEHIDGIASGGSGSAYRPFCWEYEFPEIFSNTSSGFDFVICNPPWGKIKPNIKEFYSHSSPEVKRQQGNSLREYVAKSEDHRSLLWNEYIAKTKTYSTILGKSGIYSFQTYMAEGKRTRGDSDLYKYFMERIFEISSSSAGLGLVVPSSFIVSAGAAGVRNLYLNSGEFERLYDFQNKKRFFPIHPMFRFLILSYKKSIKKGIRDARFGLTELPQKKDRSKGVKRNRVSFSRSFLSDVSPELLNVPDVRSSEQKLILHKLYKEHRRLGDRSGALWNVSFVREFDMTSDSSLFVRSSQFKKSQIHSASHGKGIRQRGEIYRPLIEGKMVHQFDYSAKAYVHGQARTAVWRPLPYVDKGIRSHYYVSESVYKDKLPLASQPRAGFCDVTGHANERTVLAALIPGDVVCGNKVPTCRFTNDDPRLHLIWIAMANSFVVDWLIRRRISTTLNFFHWDQIPFPRIAPDSGVGQILVKNSAKLSLIDEHQEEYRLWLERIIGPITIIEKRDIVRARIDACVASIYNLTLKEFETILDDFPILDRNQPRISEGKSSITKDLALLFFSRALEGECLTELDRYTPFSRFDCLTDCQLRVNTATDSGAIGYIPSELARELR